MLRRITLFVLLLHAIRPEIKPCAFQALEYPSFLTLCWQSFLTCRCHLYLGLPDFLLYFQILLKTADKQKNSRQATTRYSTEEHCKEGTRTINMIITFTLNYLETKCQKVGLCMTVRCTIFHYAVSAVFIKTNKTCAIFNTHVPWISNLRIVTTCRSRDTRLPERKAFRLCYEVPGKNGWSDVSTDIVLWVFDCAREPQGPYKCGPDTSIGQSVGFVVHHIALWA